MAFSARPFAKCLGFSACLLKHLLILLLFVAAFRFIERSALAFEEPYWHGATWHYYSHHWEAIDWDAMENYCQQSFGVRAVPIRANFCVEQGGLFQWWTALSTSCDRPCTTCPNYWDWADCTVPTCASGWWGDVSGCPSSSANLSISIFNDRDGDGVRGVDEDSVPALVRIYRSGAGEVHMFTGTGLDRDFADGDYRVKIEPNSGWIPTKWSVDHESVPPVTALSEYKACAIWALGKGIDGITYSIT